MAPGATAASVLAVPPGTVGDVNVTVTLQNPAGYVLYSTGSDGEKGTCDRAPGNDDICVELGMP